MLDPKLLRNDLEAVATRLRTKNYELDVTLISSLEERRRTVQTRTEALQADRNAQSKSIGKAKSQGEDIAPLLAAVSDLGDQLDTAKAELDSIQSESNDVLLGVPNLPDDEVPAGQSEDDNIEVSVWGDVPEFTFEAKDHVDLTDASQMLDFETAAKITGSRFVTLRGQLATMHRALTQFMLDVHINQHGYEEVYVPYIVNRESLQGTGQLPKFEEDLFKLDDDRGFYLIPTAEVPVTNIARDVLEDAQRGRRYIPCETPVASIALGERDEAVKASIVSVITLSKAYYRSGLAGLLYLPRIVRPCIYIMARTYSEIGAEILRNRIEWSRPRSVVSPLRKTWIVFSSLPYCLWLLVKKSPTVSFSTHEKSLHVELNELPGINH